MAKTYKGIDISRYQGNPDFSKVKSQVDFVIIQAGYGKYESQKDPTFESNYKGCKANNIPVGAYWFSYAKSVDEAKLEAQACLEVIKGKQFEYPIYYDVEGEALTDKTTVSNMCKAFCDILEKAGYFVGIYMSRSPAQTHLTDAIVHKYALWLAEYNSNLNWNGDVGIWQNSSTGNIVGISGDVDTNIGYVDYAKIIKDGGFNGFKKKTNSSTAKESTKILDSTGFQKGAKNAGILCYKEMLLMAHKKGLVSVKVKEDTGFGEGTKICTNELLKRFGYKQTGIMGINLVKKLAEELNK